MLDLVSRFLMCSNECNCFHIDHLHFLAMFSFVLLFTRYLRLFAALMIQQFLNTLSLSVLFTHKILPRLRILLSCQLCVLNLFIKSWTGDNCHTYPSLFAYEYNLYGISLVMEFLLFSRLSQHAYRWFSFKQQ